MHVIKYFPLIFLLISITILISSPAGAQVENKTTTKLKASEANIPKLGELAFVIFYPGSVPAANYPITGEDGKKYFSNEDGMIYLDLKEGRYNFKIEQSKQSFNVKVIAGETSQVIVNLVKGKKSLLDVEVAKESRFKKKEVKAGVPVKISGQVVDGDTGKPITGAKIYISGVDAELKTDSKGFYITTLPEGEYVVSLIHPSYGSKVFDGLQADKTHKDFKKLSLVATGLELEEFVVLAPNVKGSVAAFIEMRRQSSNVTDVIGAEELAKTGDSDAGSGLKRVTGLSLVDGKYVYVRGLGERYSSTLINGAMLASPEISRKVVPLDMFPTKFLEGMVVQKSYSPDMPAEFGGGVIQLNSKAIPYKLDAKVSISLDTSSDGQEGRLAYKGGKNDAFGFDDGTRALPKSIARTTKNRPLFEKNNINDGFSKETLAKFGKEFSNTYSIKEAESTQVPSMSMSIGKMFKYKKLHYGAMVSGLYKNSWDNKSDRVKTKYGSDGGEELRFIEKFNVVQSTNQINLGGTGEFTLGFGKNHEVNFTNIISRKTDNIVQVQDGIQDDDGIVKTDLVWIEREMQVGQLRGEHKFPTFGNLQLNWKVSKTNANHYEPDHRYIKQIRDDDGRLRLDSVIGANRRIYVNLDDKTNDFGMDLTLPVKFNKKIKTKFKVGYYQLERERESSKRQFSFDDKSGGNNPSLFYKPIEQILQQSNRSADGFIIKESTEKNDYYTAGQNINAYYGMADMEIGSFLVSGGYRLEETDQQVNTGGSSFSTDSTQVWSNIESSNLLPALSLRYKISNKNQIRASYSETISRPDFKELSPAKYEDYDSGDRFKGSADLNMTTIMNYDLRYEYYITPKESFSIGAFYKKFNSPIEAIEESGTETIYTFQNVESAVNYGVELEYRKNLGFIAKPLKTFTLVSNFSWINSEINLGKKVIAKGIMTNEKRALQGQSPYLANAQLQWTAPKYMEANLIYNVFGKRISAAGTEGRDDIYEQPVHQLDFLVKFKHKKWGNISFKAKNLLNEDVVRIQGSKITDTYSKGIGSSISYSKSF